MNLEKLNKLINKSGLKKKKIAQELNVSANSLRNKLIGATPFKWSEVQKIALLLRLDRETCESLFFDSKVADSATSNERKALNG